MQDGNDNETCETCRPDGLKVRNVNGVTQVEVPQDFASDKLGSYQSQIAQAMAFAETLQGREQAGPSLAEQKSAPNFQPTTPLGFGEETPSQPPTADMFPKPGNNQFTLAETDAREVLGLWPPKGPATTDQFTLAQTDAADVLGLSSTRTVGLSLNSWLPHEGSLGGFEYSLYEQDEVLLADRPQLVQPLSVRAVGGSSPLTAEAVPIGEKCDEWSKVYSNMMQTNRIRITA